MTVDGFLQLALYLIVLLALVKPLGAYMAAVYTGRSAVNRVCGPVERGLYRLFGVREDDEMGWQTYAAAFMLFNILGLLAVYLLQRLQGFLPAGLGGQNLPHFVSAASSMAVLVALTRGLAQRSAQQRSAQTLGSFWVDLTRSIVYILLPLSLVLALLPASQGGGGFFNTNSAHPLENPAPFSNFVEVLAILLIPAALCYTFGKLVGDTRQGWALLAAMTILFVLLLAGVYAAEAGGSGAFDRLHSDATVNPAGGNLEGKEVRFGVANSPLWAAATTAASNGSVNAMHDSFTPLGGLIPRWLMQLGEVVFGGVGSGLCGLLMFALVAVFLAGLMVGRTPEYLGKKIGAFEMKMASLAILLPCALVLLGTAVAVVTEGGLAAIYNRVPAAHGFSEVLYAFSSAANNNGSAFAGLGANTPFYNTALGIAMFAARYWLAIPVLAIGGSLAAKKAVPAGPGTLPTHTPLFVLLLIGVVVVVGALTFLPALALGPVVEHLLLVGM